MAKLFGRVSVGLTVVVAGSTFGASALAAPTPPTPGFGPSIDAFATYDAQDTCSPSAKPGVSGFKDFILGTYPNTGNSGIVRACDIGGTSEHKEGRAWDWTVNINNATQKDIAETVINWLLAGDEHGNPCALARRTGTMYLIWNKNIWGAYRSPNGSCATAGWKAYTGSNPHTDHVHISFSWAGANKQTTWWTAPLPVSCDRSAGGFTFSCDGPASGACVNVNEPSDPDSWTDNYFCAPFDFGMQWSSNGPIAGMNCTQVHEAAEPLASVWQDNYLCVPDQSPYTLSYSSAGAIEGKTCVHFNEPADAANSWSDNFVCADKVYSFSAGGFAFSMTGPLEGKHCVNVDEPGDPDTWVDNYFCSDQDIGLQWSSAGPVDGMDCVNVTEGSEENAAAWEDNYLCVPKGSPYTFSWSFAGPISGQTCVRWFEHSEKLTNTWQDNWMCFVSESAPTGSGGSSSGGEGGFGSGSGSSDGAGGDASGSASPKQRTDVLAEESGCACRAPSSAPRTPAWLALALAALALLRRRTDS